MKLFSVSYYPKVQLSRDDFLISGDSRAFQYLRFSTYVSVRRLPNNVSVLTFQYKRFSTYDAALGSRLDSVGPTQLPTYAGRGTRIAGGHADHRDRLQMLQMLEPLLRRIWRPKVFDNLRWSALCRKATSVSVGRLQAAHVWRSSPMYRLAWSRVLDARLDQ